MRSLPVGLDADDLRSDVERGWELALDALRRPHVDDADARFEWGILASSR